MFKRSPVSVLEVGKIACSSDIGMRLEYEDEQCGIAVFLRSNPFTSCHPFVS